MCEISSLICRPTKRQKSSHHRSPCDLPTPPSVTGHHAWPPFNLEATGSTSYGDTYLCQKKQKNLPGFCATTCSMACTHLFTYMYSQFAGLHNCDCYSSHICICVSVQQSNYTQLYMLILLSFHVLYIATWHFVFLFHCRKITIFSPVSPLALPCLAWFTCDALRFL